VAASELVLPLLVKADQNGADLNEVVARLQRVESLLVDLKAQGKTDLREP
jgi:hypothetical protein